MEGTGRVPEKAERPGRKGEDPSYKVCTIKKVEVVFFFLLNWSHDTTSPEINWLTS